MCSFLGTRISNHYLNEIEKELKQQKENYDEYDLYVYYKKVLEFEKRKKEKENERNKVWTKKRKRYEIKEIDQENTEDEEETFQPCHFLSSIYKKSEIKKKGIRDFIDKKDNIFEDVIVNPMFNKTESFLDNTSVSFFNENISFTLLRNNGYIDGMPIGVNLNELNFLKKCFKKKINEIKCNTSFNICNEIFEESKKCNVKENEEKKNLNIIGPKLPKLYEEVRQNFKNELNKYEHKSHSTNTNNIYAYIVACKNKTISNKLKEAQNYEKRIKDLYKPKNNFEGAYFINTNKIISDHFKYNKFIKKGGHSYDCSEEEEEEEEEEEIYEDHIFLYDEHFNDEKKKNTLHQNNNEFFKRIGYLNDEENAYGLYQKGSKNELLCESRSEFQSKLKSVEIKKKNDNFFVVDNSFIDDKKKETEIYIAFYNFLKSYNNKKTGNMYTKNNDRLLYYQYSKLKIGSTYKNSQTDKNLKSLYTPLQKWTKFNNGEKNLTSEISHLKRKINFNNDFKKKNKFIFYCKVKEMKIKIGNIFSKEEINEFSDLMAKLKVHEEFYTKEIIEDNIETNFHIEDYHFNKEVLKKLNVSTYVIEDTEKEEITEMTNIIPHISLSLFSIIFDS